MYVRKPCESVRGEERRGEERRGEEKPYSLPSAQGRVLLIYPLNDSCCVWFSVWLFACYVCLFFRRSAGTLGQSYSVHSYVVMFVASCRSAVRTAESSQAASSAAHRKQLAR